MKMLTLSLVIPVYNEEHHLKACLDAVALQTVKPLEVIVVDNNSTDNTVKIAKKYPFVTVITEENQGKGHARSAGLSAARGDILGRIDADSVVMPNWVERVLADFTDDATVMGVTGPAYTVTITLRLLPNFYSVFWSRGYFWSAHADTRLATMWGANMALRRSAWKKVRNEMCLDDKKVHEDVDLSLVMWAHHLPIRQDNALRITTKDTSFIYFPKMVYYFGLRYNTLRIHKDVYKRGSGVKLTGFLKTQGYRLMSTVPSIIFIASSLINLPIDLFMLYVVKNKRWLD